MPTFYSCLNLIIEWNMPNLEKDWFSLYCQKLFIRLAVLLIITRCAFLPQGLQLFIICCGFGFRSLTLCVDSVVYPVHVLLISEHLPGFEQSVSDSGFEHQPLNRKGTVCLRGMRRRLVSLCGSISPAALLRHLRDSNSSIHGFLPKAMWDHRAEETCN